jgi:ABC-type multidrug transport system ATPase subunit
MTAAGDLDIGVINVAGKSELRLGRVREGNDVVLPHPAVAAHHTRLRLRPDGAWWTEDLNSDHGTYVNLRRVGPAGLPIRLEADTLWIAPYALRVSEEADSIRPSPSHLRLDLVNLRRAIGSRTLLDIEGTPLSFRPGEFIAIVGGSGAGKSTLLKALLGVDSVPGRGRSGDVYFNNQLLIHGADAIRFTPLNTIVGYVPQYDDSMHFHLSPLEALNFAALLRFAGDLTPRERSDRVRAALASVKLLGVDLQKTQIHRLSGGQRKRVNVAMELVAEPRVLFLDEPTSGLDPGLDLDVMSLLRDWALGGQDGDRKTIVLITHATENVRLCDYVIFLGATKVGGEIRGGSLLYFGSPGPTMNEFFGLSTSSEVYRRVQVPEEAATYHEKLASQDQWNRVLWDRARTSADIEESAHLKLGESDSEGTRDTARARQIRRQFEILARRYWLVLRRDRNAFLFQLLEGVLVALLLWGVASPDALTVAGARAAPTTLFVLTIAATWLGTLNATKEIVRERRVFGRERRYGVHPVAYVLSKVAVLGSLGIWQMAGLAVVALFRFTPESHIGTLARAMPAALQIPFSMELEWLITLELLLLAGLALGLCISAWSNSLDQATLLMFPAMLIQVMLAGLLFDVGPLASLAFSHWGLQALGNSLDVEGLFIAAGKGSDPILTKVDLAGNALGLVGDWLVLAIFCVGLVALTCWRQGWADKARIPED